MHRFAHAAVLCLVWGSVVLAQDTPTQPVQPAQPTASKPNDNTAVTPQEDKRVFGVLPNYRTTENSIPFKRISAGQKLKIAFKDSFDWPSYITGGLLAGVYQLDNSNPSFG